MEKYLPFIAHRTNKPQFYKRSLIRTAVGLHEQLTEIISKKLPIGAKILDFGCGQGALSLRLQDLGYDVLAVDKDANDFQCHGQIKFEKLNFDDQKEIKVFFERHQEEFDMVLGIEVIEHVENPWNYVRDLKTLLKKDGYMLIST
ncbi:MAG: methyltransferase domain-containing protein, partial [Bacteroidales bacterium]